MSQSELRFRQIHLDFHTSPEIEGIAAGFDPEEFARTLEAAHVDSITCFARGHHGMLYYDSKLFPERIHPHLANKNLLQQQIDAGHKLGIRVPIYITVQWDHFTANEHPEWLALDEDGHPIGTPIYEAGFYRHLCVNSPYRDFLKAHTREVLETFDVDGLFFDIVQVKECSCRYCRAGMEGQGMDPTSSSDRMAYAQQMINQFKTEMTEFVRQFNTECSIFYNKGHVGTAHRPVTSAYTHFELESLPSGQWGYMHFPITMRYARTLGLDCLSHTGKFHTSWGDFHSFKNQAALEFECFHMLALNSKCLIGDQLEPNGRLSQAVYDLVGSVYAQVEAKEPWCKGATAVTDIGVFTTEEFFGGSSEGLPPEMLGVSRMLQEAGHQFDILDSYSDLSKYKLLVLPDRITLTKRFSDRLQDYVSKGGKVIASFESGLDDQKKDFALKAFGLRLIGPAPFSPDFLVPTEDFGTALPKTEHVMYLQGLQVAVEEGEILVETKVPFFNRTWEHFCSHRHTPSSSQVGYPGIVRNRNVIYFMHPIFTQYDKNAPRWCKQLFLDAVDMFLPDPAVSHDGPSSLIVTLNEQASENRGVLHLLHYIPERRSKDIDVIENVIPLYKVNLSVRADAAVQSVTLVPQMQELEFSTDNGRVVTTIPELHGHQMVEIAYQS